MLDDLRQQLENITERDLAFQILQRSDEAAIHLQMFADDGELRGELWIAGGRSIMAALASPSGNGGYLGLLEILALRETNFKADAITQAPAGEPLNIGLDEIIADEQKVIDSIKSMIWPLPEDEDGVEEVHDASSSPESSEPEAPVGAVDEPAVPFSTESGAMPAIDDQVAKRLDELKTFSPSTQAPETFNQETILSAKEDDERERRIAQYKRLKVDSEASSAFYESTSTELNKPEPEKFTLQPESTLETREYAPAEQVDEQSSATSGEQPGAIALPTPPVPPKRPFARSLKNEGWSLMASATTSQEQPFRFQVRKGALLIAANLLTAALLIVGLATLQASLNAKVHDQDRQYASRQIDKITDEESLVQTPDDSFRQPAPAQISAGGSPGSTNNAHSEYAEDDPMASMTWSQPSQPAPVLTQAQLKEINDQIQQAEAKTAQGNLSEAFWIYRNALQRYPYYTKLRVKSIEFAVRLKDYQQAKSLCTDGFTRAQSQIEFNIFMAMFKNIPGVLHVHQRSTETATSSKQ